MNLPVRAVDAVLAAVIFREVAKFVLYFQNQSPGLVPMVLHCSTACPPLHVVMIGSIFKWFGEYVLARACSAS